MDCSNKETIVKINRLTLSLAALLLVGCNPLPVHRPTTPDEAPTLACPCPDFATQDHPEDPNEAPGEWCLAKSRTGLWMDAREHPRCQREARERAGREG